MAGSIGLEVTPRREWPRASADGWLSLVAAPTFAIMALLTGIHGGGMPDVLCSTAQDAWALTGMVPMYSLMSAFHLAPWLKLISCWRSPDQAMAIHPKQEISDEEPGRFL